MALTRSNDPQLKYLAEEVYRRTGKVVRAVVKDVMSLRVFVLFEDGTEGVLLQGETIESMEIREKPKAICASCGEEAHISTFDWQGRCHMTVHKFWEKVRKIYWHRHTQRKV